MICFYYKRKHFETLVIRSIANGFFSVLHKIKIIYNTYPLIIFLNLMYNERFDFSNNKYVKR